MVPPKLRFIAEPNLGKLAKWLRLLGFDVILDQSLAFDRAKVLALREERVVLTRNRKHHSHKEGCKCLLIVSDLCPEQLEEVIKVFKPQDFRIFSRCCVCNRPLYEIDGAKVADRVPGYVLTTSQEFKVCRHCGRIYWKGTHYIQIEKIAKTLLEISI